MVIGMKLYRE